MSAFGWSVASKQSTLGRDGRGVVVLLVDPGLPTPPFEQIKAQIEALRASGEFPALHRLPPVRQLAAELGVAPNTVARAYRELEASGIIETRGRAGSFVTAMTSQSARKQAVVAAHDYVTRVRDLGLSDSDALHVLRELLGPDASPAPCG